LLFYTTIWFCI